MQRLLDEMAALNKQVAAVLDQLRPRGPALQAPHEPDLPQPVSSGLPASGLYATFFDTFALYRPPTKLSLGRKQAVLALCRYLVAHAGQFVPRDVLLELLWPEAEPERSVHRLHVAVSSLRTVVDAPALRESCIQLENDCYWMDGDAVATDCKLFENLWRHGNEAVKHGHLDGAHAVFKSALDLYRGDYLADYPYAEWTHQPRAHFVECRLAALTFLCEYADHHNDLAAVIEHAQHIVAIDNLRERAYRHLMRAHYHLGQRACAVREYHACAAILGRDLGVLPSQQTQTLFDAICNDSPLPSETPLWL